MAHTQRITQGRSKGCTSPAWNHWLEAHKPSPYHTHTYTTDRLYTVAQRPHMALLLFICTATHCHRMGGTTQRRARHVCCKECFTMIVIPMHSQTASFNLCSYCVLRGKTCLTGTVFFYGHQLELRAMVMRVASWWLDRAMFILLFSFFCLLLHSLCSNFIPLSVVVAQNSHHSLPRSLHI